MTGNEQPPTASPETPVVLEARLRVQHPADPDQLAPTEWAKAYSVETVQDMDDDNPLKGPLLMQLKEIKEGALRITLPVIDKSTEALSYTRKVYRSYFERDSNEPVETEALAPRLTAAQRIARWLKPASKT